MDVFEQLPTGCNLLLLGFHQSHRTYGTHCHCGANEGECLGCHGIQFDLSQALFQRICGERRCGGGICYWCTTHSSVENGDLSILVLFVFLIRI